MCRLQVAQVIFLLAVTVATEVLCLGRGVTIRPTTNVSLCIQAKSRTGSLPTLEKCNNSGAQTFAISSGGQIASLAYPGLCLDNANGIIANANPVQMWTCAVPDVNQQWFYANGIFSSGADSTYQLTVYQSNMKVGGQLVLYANAPPGVQTDTAWVIV